jgi:DNA-directed RNA polymerase specialized sigma24 family protein
MPEKKREAFDLVRTQGLWSAEVAQILSVSGTTVNRWLNRSPQMLADLGPNENISGSN